MQQLSEKAKLLLTYLENKTPPIYYYLIAQAIICMILIPVAAVFKSWFEVTVISALVPVMLGVAHIILTINEQ